MRKPRTHSSQTVFANEWIAVKIDTLSFGQNHTYSYTYIDKSHAGAMVIPYFTETDSVLMVSQYRHPVKRVALGFPGGSIDKAAKQTARQELLEETGYRAEKLIDLGQFMPDIGIQSDIGQVFVALNPTKVAAPSQNTDEETTLPVIKTISEVKELIRQGEIRDGWSLGPFAIFLMWLESKEAKQHV